MNTLRKHAVRTALVAMAMTMSGAAMAADIGNLSGQSCGGLTGTWHFVNNQVPRGSGPGTLTASWSGGSCTVGPSTINTSVQHFYCTASGELLSASTNLGGRLVLSDFTCDTKCDKNCEPPKK